MKKNLLACLLTALFAAAGTLLQAQTAPTGVSATDGTLLDRVTVSWDDMTADSYSVFRNTYDDPLSSETLTTGLVALSFDDTAALPGKRYFYWVTAFYAASGESGYSHSDVGFSKPPATKLSFYGSNDYGQSERPPEIRDEIIAIAAGNRFNLILRDNGTPQGWGANYNPAGDFTGQAMPPPTLTGVTGLDAGFYHGVAVKNDGTLESWGDDTYGQVANTPALTDARKIAAGGNHSLVIREGGILEAWGDDRYGQATVPPELIGEFVVGADGGEKHSVAVKDNGAVVAWGDNGKNQLNVPGELSNVVQVSAGHNHCLALKADGTVEAWGDNEFGQATVPSTLTDVIHISAGGFHSLALRSDGTVVAWGDSNYDQTTVPDNLFDIIAVSAGKFHSLALKIDGTISGWGGVSDSSAAGKIPRVVEDIVSYDSGGGHHLAIRTDGTVIAWGRNDKGQCNVPDNIWDPVKVAAGGAHSLALQSDGTVVAWGDDTYGQATGTMGWSGVLDIEAGLFHSLGIIQPISEIVACGIDDQSADDYGQVSDTPFVTGAVDISAGAYHNTVLLDTGSMQAWGRDDSGQGTIPGGLDGVIVTGVASGELHNAVIQEDGTVYAWGNDNSGATTVPSELTDPELAKVADLVCGNSFNLALRSDGSVTSWGDNTNGQLPEGITGALAMSAGNSYSSVLHLAPPRPGNLKASDGLHADKIELIWDTVPNVDSYAVHRGTINDPAAATIIATGLSAATTSYDDTDISLTAGDIYYYWVSTNTSADGDSLFSNADGGYLAQDLANADFWGANFDGVAAPGIDFSLVQRFDLGFRHGVALLDDATVQCWGWTGPFPNDLGATQGPLYNGQFDPTDVPPELADPGTAQVRDVHAGAHHCLALKTDGTVRAWGWNTNGQAAVPAQLHGVVQIAAGAYHNLALKHNGRVVAWGGNEHGQTTVPLQVGDPSDPAFTGAVEIAAGRAHSLALLPDETVLGWGDNTYYQLDLAAFSGVKAVAAGRRHSLVLLSDGSVTGAGDNTYGQTTIPSAAVDVQKIWAGWDHNLALLGDGSFIAWGRNDYSQAMSPGESFTTLGDCGGCEGGAGGGGSGGGCGCGAPHDTAVTAEKVAAEEGDNVMFQCYTVGETPLSFQWRKNGGDIDSETEDYLYLTSTTFDDDADYSVHVSNNAGDETSPDAPLAVLAAYFKSWLTPAYFTEEESEDPEKADYNADPDEDGMENLLEYAFNLDPAACDSAGVVTSDYNATGDTLCLSITFPVLETPDANVYYRVEKSSDLQTWSLKETVDTSGWSSGDFGDYTSEDCSDPHFLRIRIEEK